MSNASSFKYEVLPLGNHVKTIVFQASAPADLRVVLGSSEKFDDDEAVSYNLVMGGEDNMYSWISKQMNGEILQFFLMFEHFFFTMTFLLVCVDWTGLSEIKTKIATPKILRQDRLQTFWISWDQIKLGELDLLVVYTDPLSGLITFRFVSFREKEEKQAINPNQGSKSLAPVFWQRIAYWCSPARFNPTRGWRHSIPLHWLFHQLGIPRIL